MAICQNAGLINTYLQDPDEGYDSILIGTSLSGNFLSKNIAQKTSWKKTLKLTAPALSPLEQKSIAERALATGNITHVFWEIFPLKYFQLQNADPENNMYGDFPIYLYNKSRLDDYNYIFNMTTLAGAFSSLSDDEYSNIASMDKINYWDNDCKTDKTCIPFRTAGKIAEMKSAYIHAHNEIPAADEVNAINYSAADLNLLPTLLHHCNDNTRFDLFFPPVSMLWLATQEKNSFNYNVYLLRHIVGKVASCKNIRVYAFYNELWITGDLARYSDTVHFFGDAQDYIMESTGKGKHIITMDNIEEYEKTLIKNVNSYTPWASTKEELHNSSH
ncbi:MAG TPA: hypothetical protein VLB90_01320 [Pseudomonadales bacterium]|nr:hypothetical protein [Pseudomonadales bacterium]